MVDDQSLKAWFVQEILPLEAALNRYIRRNGGRDADVADIRQDIYVRLYTAAREELPRMAKPFLFATARNYLINGAKRAQVVSIEYVAELEASASVDEITPERNAIAFEELRQLRAGMEQLPPRCREVVTLRKIEGLSTREAASRLDVGIDTIEQQMVHGMRALVDFMLGGSGKIRRPPAKKARSERGEKK
ncbi:RNA polymerase sigma factor [Undibacterium sp.]|jgi:RNA polymerase sigma factor (sigma-70 family)|uniref:RNA polymerase sigma factor n=1 Tax=Undibacterium sp. TaxID=1914977 RepID=UPI002BBDA801|nr:RNA polymerase sigma factor [Undibacterium sp.]HTD03875.1 RNA polymerase sigma factor [Undibacterium sp.]